MEDGDQNAEQATAETPKETNTLEDQQNLEEKHDEQDLEEKPTEEQEEKPTEEELEKWRKDFDLMADVNGFITRADLEITLQKDKKNPTPSNIDDLMAVIDTDGDGKFGFDEYVKIQQAASKMTFFSSDIQKELEEALKAFDENNDGTISKTELKTILGPEYDDDALNDVIKSADTNGDGQLSIKELAVHLTNA